MVLRKIACCVFVLGLCCGCRPVRVHLPPDVPFPGPDPACVAELLASDNNQVLTRTFDLREESVVRIVGQGEGTSFGLVPGFIESYLNDCVEFFIDLGFICRQYRFVWGSEVVAGNNVAMEGVQFAQGDPSPSRYVFELAFPWRTLGFAEAPSDDAVLRMDVSVIDNDDESRKAQIAWSGTDAELYIDWSQFGVFPLEGHRTPQPPVVDGLPDDVWEDAAWYAVAHVILGSVRDESDLSAGFRLLWDRECLYLWVEVEDDAKRQAAFMFDRGSLSDASGREWWRMTFGHTTHAGGALKNRRQEDTLCLPAGRYCLRYETDESHAAGHWDDLPPAEPFSGIKIYSLSR